MKKRINLTRSTITNLAKGGSFLCLICLLVLACNKAVPNLLNKEYPDAVTEGSKQKVLYIIVDGLRGQSVQTITPPNIAKLLPNSLFTYYGLANYRADALTGAAGWANMMTGVDVNKHQVNEDFSGNNLSNYPSLISRVKARSLQVAAFSASAAFNDNLTSQADIKKVYSSDEGVKNGVADELRNGSSDLIVAQFHSLETASSNGQHDETDTQYKDALLQVDGYIGALINELSGRAGFENENWLVVIASNKGGASSDETRNAFEDASRNVFVLYYNPKFGPKVIVKPEMGNVPYVTGAPRYVYTTGIYPNAVLGDGSKYNLIAGGREQTIQFAFKNKLVASYGWPTVISKRASGFSGTGWNLFLKGNYWTINTSMSGEIDGTAVSDGNWHVITLVLKRTVDSCIVRTYTDGVFNNQGVRVNTGEVIDNTTPLRIGRIPNDGDSRPDILVTNLQIYSRALKDAEIASVYCKTEIDSTHPYYQDLAGYWPCNETGEKVMHEKTGKGGAGSDFTFTGNYTWESVSEYSANLCPPISPAFYRQSINLVDLPVQILQWLSIPVVAGWNLDGAVWSPVYTAVQN